MQVIFGELSEFSQIPVSVCQNLANSPRPFVSVCKTSPPAATLQTDKHFFIIKKLIVFSFSFSGFKDRELFQKNAAAGYNCKFFSNNFF